MDYFQPRSLGGTYIFRSLTNPEASGELISFVASPRIEPFPVSPLFKWVFAFFQFLMLTICELLWWFFFRHYKCSQMDVKGTNWTWYFMKWFKLFLFFNNFIWSPPPENAQFLGAWLFLIYSNFGPNCSRVIYQGHSYAWSRTRLGGWVVAQSPILNSTISLKRLNQRGYRAMLELYWELTLSVYEPLYTRPVRSSVWEV